MKKKKICFRMKNFLHKPEENNLNITKSIF